MKFFHVLKRERCVAGIYQVYFDMLVLCNKHSHKYRQGGERHGEAGYGYLLSKSRVNCLVFLMIKIFST